MAAIWKAFWSKDTASGVTKRKDIEIAFGQKDITSTEMRRAIKEWLCAYFERIPTKHSDPCQRMPYTITHKLQKAVFAEYDSDLKNKNTNKEQFLDKCLKNIDLEKEISLQWALNLGLAFLKPVPAIDDDGTYVFLAQLVRRDNIYIFARNAAGKITSLGTTEETAVNNMFYTLLERRDLDAFGYLTITNTLYASRDRDRLGTQTSLNELPQYENLAPKHTYPIPIYNVGLAKFCTKIANCIDGSKDAVSIYEPAMGLIHNVNRNEALINGEFEKAKHRIVAPADTLLTDNEGSKYLEDDVFIGLNDIRADMQMKAFSPALRYEPYHARKQSYLKDIESKIGFKRGLLADVTEVEKTKYEIASTAGDYSLTLTDIQHIWYDGLCEYLQLCDKFGQMFGYVDSGKWEVSEELSVNWGNGVLYDKEQAWQDIVNDVAQGLLKPEIAVAWKYDLPWETMEDLTFVREKYMPEINSLLSG